jgi:hypothetical protein
MTMRHSTRTPPEYVLDPQGDAVGMTQPARKGKARGESPVARGKGAGRVLRGTIAAAVVHETAGFASSPQRSEGDHPRDQQQQQQAKERP